LKNGKRPGFQALLPKGRKDVAESAKVAKIIPTLKTRKGVGGWACKKGKKALNRNIRRKGENGQAALTEKTGFRYRGRGGSKRRGGGGATFGSAGGRDCRGETDST